MRRLLAIVAVGSLIVAVFIVLRGPSDEQRYGATGTVLESADHGPELCLGAIQLSLPPKCRGLPLVGWEWEDVADEESASGTTWVEAYVEGTYDGTRFTLTRAPRPPRRVAQHEPSFEQVCDEPIVVDPSHGIGEWEEATQADGGAINELPGLVAIWVTGPGTGTPNGPFTANVIVRPGSRDQAQGVIRRHWRGHLCLVERDQPTTRELDAVMARLDDVLTQNILIASPNYQRGVVEATIVVVDDKALAEVTDAFGEGVVVLTGELKPL